MHLAAEGGHIEVIKFLLPLFGERVHEKDNHSYTMLHLTAEKGHCKVARYLIDEVHMDPQDRDKVCGVPGDCAGFKVRGLNVSCTSVFVCVCVSLCSMLSQTDVTWTCLCNAVAEASSPGL